MFNLRYSGHALKALLEFKGSKEMYPTEEQLIMYLDLLQVPGPIINAKEIFTEAYEYFYSHKKNSILLEVFLKWITDWSTRVNLRTLKTQLDTERIVYLIIVDTSVISTNSRAYQCRERLTKNISSFYREVTESNKRIKPVYSENILENTAKNAGMSGLLAFVKRKETTESTFETTKTRILPLGRMHKNITTFRKSSEIRTPVRMVFYKHHGQIRPAYYNIKQPRTMYTRITIRKILPEEEYLYDSEEEWIEGDGESVDKEEQESEEEPLEEDILWIEPDAEDNLFRKGQLPTLDHPNCYHFLIPNQSTSSIESK
ncbi:hypothetical protein NEOKW01_1811 [Nematocida sp. AWRm80]|nr:hypothetical protein NEOKW01_1811 [Nematocida sp. AWRm80]